MAGLFNLKMNMDGSTTKLRQKEQMSMQRMNDRQLFVYVCLVCSLFVSPQALSRILDADRASLLHTHP